MRLEPNTTPKASSRGRIVQVHIYDSQELCSTDLGHLNTHLSRPGMNNRSVKALMGDPTMDSPTNNGGSGTESEPSSDTMLRLNLHLTQPQKLTQEGVKIETWT